MLQVPFKPRAQILLQLGEQLIKNENIAILELVKNSYDADAKKVKVNMIDVNKPSEGYIEIIDNGCGMDKSIIQNIWMEPGNSHKKRDVLEEKRTELGRLPIGEKGIGRFGVHKLGKVIELISRSKDKQEVVMKIDWRVFETAEYLSDVKITIQEREPMLFLGNKTGTYIKIHQLSTEWTRGMYRNLHRSLTALNSPFQSNSSFKVYLETNLEDWKEGLIRFQDIKKYALFECYMELIGEKLVCFKYKFKPYDMMHDVKDRVVIYDSPIIMRKKVTENGKSHMRDINLKKYNIGKIIIKLYAFDRDVNILNKYIPDKAAFKKYLDENGGISVFRDGLRVLDYGEPGNDWLGLDLKRVNAPTRNLSNNIILGAVYLDRRDSSDLKEKANREGFIEDEAYRCFRDAVVFALGQFTAQRNIDKEYMRLSSSGGAKEPVKAEITEIRKTLAASDLDKSLKEQIEKSLSKVENELEFLKQRYLKTASAGMSYGIVIHEIEKIIYELKVTISREGASEKIKILSRHLSRLIDSYSELLRNKAKAKHNLVEVIEQALFSIEYRLDAHKIEIINLYSDKDEYIVECASNMVIGAIINVIDNSIYWTAYAKKPNKKILIKLTDEIEGFISIVIADNGTGFKISGEDAIKPFVSTREEGIGLGLNIVSEIMLSQKGTILFPERGDIDLPEEFSYGAIVALAFAKE